MKVLFKLKMLGEFFLFAKQLQKPINFPNVSFQKVSDKK